MSYSWMCVLTVLTIAVVVMPSGPAGAGSQEKPVVVKLEGLTARIVAVKRARSWAGATSTGFTTNSAPEGRDFIVLQYELTPAEQTDSLYLQYSKLEDAKGNTYFATGGSQGITKESGAKTVDQFFSVPADTQPAALLLGRLGPAASGGAGDRPEWVLAHRIDLKSVPVRSEK